MTAEDYVALRESRGASVRRTADGYMAQCPAHADRTPSLHVSEGDDGRVLLSCQAGCCTGDVLDADGLVWPDLYPDDVHRNGHEPETTYDYHDADGHLLGQIVRQGAKKWARRPGGAQQWVNDWQGVPRVLYDLPGLLQAIAAGEPVHFPEGESDADALRRAGVPATTTPFGAGARWEQSYSDALRGADVIVWRDRDEPGHERGARVMQALDGVAGSVLLVEPREGKDARDHLRAGYGPWEFVVVRSEAPTRSSVLDLLIDLTAVPDEPPRMIVEPLAAEGYLTELVGKRGTFKSFLTLAFGHCCHSGGGELAGLRCEPALTLIIDGENGPYLLRNRYTACGISPATGPLVADGTQIKLPKDLGRLRELIVATGAKLVILDALRRLTPGLDEDSSKDMAPVIAALATMARELQVAIVLLHHQSSKPGAPPSRGSSAIEDQVDAVMRLKRYPGNRLKLWVGEGGKYRFAEEPEPLWMDFKWVNGLFTLGACEAVQEADEEDSGPSAQELVAKALSAYLRAAPPLPLGDGSLARGYTKADLARAIGRNPRDGTVTRALEDLQAQGLITRGEDKLWRLTADERPLSQTAIYDYDPEEG